MSPLLSLRLFGTPLTALTSQRGRLPRRVVHLAFRLLHPKELAKSWAFWLGSAAHQGADCLAPLTRALLRYWTLLRAYLMALLLMLLGVLRRVLHV